MTTWAEVNRWNAQTLGAAGDSLNTARTTLEESRDAVETAAIPASWSGIARVAALAQRTVLVTSMNARLSTLRTLVRGLFAAESAVETLLRDIESCEGSATARGFEVGTDGSVRFVGTVPEFETQASADAWSAGMSAQARIIAEEVSGLLDRAASIDADLVATISFRDSESELRGVTDPEVAREWSQMTQAERERVLRQIVEEELADLDLDPPPSVTFVDPDADPDDDYDPGPNGWWSADRNEIWINPNAMDDPRRIHTAAHEARHTRQSAASDALDRSWWDRITGHDPFKPFEDAGTSRDQAEEWRDNFDDYIGSDGPGGFDAYAEQPVEEDAFGRGKEYLEDTDADDLADLRERAR